VLRELSPSIAQQLTETGTFFRHPALQGADAYTQIFRHLAEIGTMRAKEPQQDPFYPGSDGLPRLPLRDLALELRTKHREEFGVVGDEGAIEIGRPKNDGVPRRFELHAAAVVGFVNLLVIGVSLQFEPQRLQRLPGTAPSELEVGGNNTFASGTLAEGVLHISKDGDDKKRLPGNEAAIWATIAATGTRQACY
jgi:hypothetical protein